MWQSCVESIIIFADNSLKNLLNQSVIRDHLGNCLVNEMIASGDVLKAELSREDVFYNSNGAIVISFRMCRVEIGLICGTEMLRELCCHLRVRDL